MRLSRNNCAKSTASTEAMIGVHAVAAKILGVGVLLRGPSGCGKSRLAMELLARGHCLIADDAVNLTLESGQVMAHGDADMAGFLAVRGVGVVNVVRSFGESAWCAASPVHLVLEAGRDSAQTDDQDRQTELLGVPLPLYRTPDLAGAAVLTELVCRQFMQHQAGYDAATDLAARQARAITAQAP